MSNFGSGLIKAAVPRAGVEGGEVVIACEGYDTSEYSSCHVWFGDQRGRLTSAAPDRVIVTIPDCETGIGANELKLESASGTMATSFALGVKLADNLHPVANPAVDRDDGSIYVTLSGTRGQKVPVSIYKISPDETVSPFVSDVVNPTGLAFNREGTLYVTSRYDGALYRISPFGEVETIASDLGVATGVAFDRRGEIYVGDRSGTIFRVNELGESRPFASLDPSVAAFHLAFSPDGDLYVSGPTVSSFESILRVNAMGDVTKFYTGLGRPQGLAFDAQGNLYVAASIGGHRGIVRITPDGRNAEVVVAGSSLVGLAFDDGGNMIVVSTQKVYRVPMGIKGYSVF
jgi:sugar lactone lactonase YvrE